jgi:hypothetical protein
MALAKGKEMGSKYWINFLKIKSDIKKKTNIKHHDMDHIVNFLRTRAMTDNSK